MKTIRLKNNTQTADYWIGVLIQPGQYYQLQNDTDLHLAINEPKVNQDIWSTPANLIINDGISDLDPASGDKWLKGVNVAEVTTQFEKSDKTTKLVKGKATVNVNTKKAIVLLKVPGVPGSGDGRYVSGGFAISEDYDKDDYATTKIKDEDRMLAWQVALAQNPNATAPIADADMQAMGIHPILGDLTKYPYVRSYTEEEANPENEGWFFWPISMGNNLPPIGETEVESLGGYGFLPSGFYLEVTYIRQTLTTGGLRINVEWGKKE